MTKSPMLQIVAERNTGCCSIGGTKAPVSTAKARGPDANMNNSIHAVMRHALCDRLCFFICKPPPRISMTDYITIPARRTWQASHFLYFSKNSCNIFETFYMRHPSNEQIHRHAQQIHVFFWKLRATIDEHRIFMYSYIGKSAFCTLLKKVVLIWQQRNSAN